VLIASGLPLQGPQAAVTNAMADAVRSVLRRHRFRAGRFKVGFESCDDSTAQSGGDDFLKCASNAKAFADTPRLVGVIGPYTSDCAKVTISLTARAAPPLALISPSNTLAGLTHHVAESAYGEPGRYYPTGVRNYFRTVASDDLQGAGQAVLAHELGLRRVYLLSAGAAPYGPTVAGGFRRAAARVGVVVVGSSSWNPGAEADGPLARTVARSRPDGVVLAGYGGHGGALIRALRAQLGPGVKVIADDGFLPVPALVGEAGSAATGVYVTFPGVVDTGGTYVPEAEASAQVLLAAIARSDGTRGSVLEALRGLRVNTVLGPIRFDRNGDMTPALVEVVRIDPDAHSGLTGELRESRRARVLSVPTAPVG
jgi:branched-chain amino acid transport system substrate-binding protein